MKTNQSANRSALYNLTVSHKLNSTKSDLHELPDAIITTDPDFKITGWNDAAEKLHGLPGAMGKNLFGLIKLEFPNSSFEKIKKQILLTGNWQGEVIYRRYNGESFIFYTSASTIINEKNKPIAIIFANHNITHEKNTEKKLAEAEASYEKVVNTLVNGVLMIDKNGRITTCNKRAAEILHMNNEQLVGFSLNDIKWSIIKQDGSQFPWFEFPATVSLQTGFPQRNVKMGITLADDSLIWLDVNSEALIRPGEFEPYAAVISFSDITDAVIREEELRKSNERFFYVSKITSDAIWDFDLQTNKIYRSETFSELSGYGPDEIAPDLNWWFNKIHPDDKERVSNKVQEYLTGGLEKWEDEYRFMCADGTYKFILDTGIIQYDNDKPVRILGAIRDLTEKKKLEQQLLYEQEQKLKAISQAVIAAQEEERSKISCELHDNVNQVLMSVKMYMESVMNNPARAKEYIQKASDNQMIAVEEIRKLSHELNSSRVKLFGLQQSIKDLIQNMFLLQNIHSTLEYNARLDKLLSHDQQLMIYRIVQEQTNNIIKYADAGNVTISLKEQSGFVLLCIADDGKGFDPATRPGGIGLMNISNRVEAFGGEMKLESQPEMGCILSISFPLVYN